MDIFRPQNQKFGQSDETANLRHAVPEPPNVVPELRDAVAEPPNAAREPRHGAAEVRIAATGFCGRARELPDAVWNVPRAAPDFPRAAAELRGNGAEPGDAAVENKSAGMRFRPCKIGKFSSAY
jgi:hypothetical protein